MSAADIAPCPVLTPGEPTRTPTPTRPTRLQSYVRHTLFPREEVGEDVRVGVGVGVVECQIIPGHTNYSI